MVQLRQDLDRTSLDNQKALAEPLLLVQHYEMTTSRNNRKYLYQAPDTILSLSIRIKKICLSSEDALLFDLYLFHRVLVIMT